MKYEDIISRVGPRGVPGVLKNRAHEHIRAHFFL